MSFFPAGFDARADVVGALQLVEIDTPDGACGFLPGMDGRFVSTDARVWWGSVLLASEPLEMSIGGVAPAGSLTLEFFQDPDAPDLIAQIRALGSDYVRGREIRFYVQPLTSHAEIHAPVLAPIPLARRVARSISHEIKGPVQRAISLSFEGPFAGRAARRGYTYGTVDHSLLAASVNPAVAGQVNPSLSLIPYDRFTEQPLFG